MLLTGLQPFDVQAASGKYVKSLSISRKSLILKKGQNKTISYKVRVRGKASRKISVKASNSNVKVSVKKGRIKISAKRIGNCNITVSTKSKNKKGKKIKKRIQVKVVSPNKSSKEDSNKQDQAYSLIPSGITPKESRRPVSTRKPIVDATIAPIKQPTDSPDIGTGVEGSRSEWVATVMKLTGYQGQKELFDYHADGTISYSFTDISGRSDAELLETAVKYGIIPQSGGKFYPDDAVDREFLAVTSVRAIGFVANENAITFTDMDDLEYAEEDAVAVQIGLLKNQKNQFDPTGTLNRAERQTAERVLSEIMAAREINENHEDTIEYSEDVVQDEDITDYLAVEEDGACTVMLSTGTEYENISVGDSIYLPPTEDHPEGVALVVTGGNLLPDDKVQFIVGTVPEEVTDFVESVDIEGTAEASLDEATAVDGVATVTVEEGKKDATKRNGIRGKSIEGSVDLENQTKVSYTVKELGTTVSFCLSDLQYKIDFDNKKVNELYIGLPNVLALETDYKANKKFSKKLGEIPIQLPAGFSANIEVFLETEIGGEISLDFKLSNSIGVQYYNGMFSLKKSCEPSLDVMVDADLDAGAKLQLGLYWMKGVREIVNKGDSKPIYNINTKWGLHGDATLHIRNDQYTSYDDLVCVDLGYYLYGNVSVGEGSYLGETFQLKKTWWIFDKKNSPLKKEIHIENGRIIAACSYKADDPGLGDQAWKSAYIEFIENFDKGYNEYDGTYGNTYHLINVNNDNIPELYINTNTTAGGSWLCTYYNNQVVTQFMWISGLSYIEGENLMMDSGGHMDNYYDDIYCLEDGQFIQLDHGEYNIMYDDDGGIQFDGEGNAIYEYFWNYEPLSSEKEYVTLLSSVYDISNSINPFENAEYDPELGHDTGDGIYGYEEIEEVIGNY